MENPALHKVPALWTSDSKNTMTIGLVFAFVVFFATIFFTSVLESFGCCMFGMFISIIIGVISLQKMYDNKDDWYRKFRYNERQFHQIGMEIQEYLAFTKVGFYGGNKPIKRFLMVIPHWEFVVSTVPALTISLDVSDEGSNGKFTKIAVKNVVMMNLDDAKNIVDVINHIIGGSNSMGRPGQNW